MRCDQPVAPAVVRADGRARAASPQPHRRRRASAAMLTHQHDGARLPRRRQLDADVQVEQQIADAGAASDAGRPSERRAARAWPSGCASAAFAARRTLRATRGSLHAPQQQRDADQEQQRAADPMQDRHDRRQRLPDREQVEIDRARLDDGTVERRPSSGARGETVATTRRHRDARRMRRSLQSRFLCAATNYSAPTPRRASARACARSIRDVRARRRRVALNRSSLK